MAGTLVFVPVIAEQAAALAAGTPLGPVDCFRVTGELLETVGLGPGDDEDAERACLLLASVHALATSGRRLVLVAEVQPASLVANPDERHNGGARLAGLVPRQVQCFFADDPADPLPGRVAQRVAGRTVDEAWDDEGVQELLATHDLLWHGAEELARLGQDG